MRRLALAVAMLAMVACSGEQAGGRRGAGEAMKQAGAMVDSAKVMADTMKKRADTGMAMVKSMADTAKAMMKKVDKK